MRLGKEIVKETILSMKIEQDNPTSSAERDKMREIVVTVYTRP